MNNKVAPSLDEVHVNAMNCYFSEIAEVAPAHTHSTNANNPSNCHVSFSADSLLIVTSGGNKFYLSLDQQISRVFPMVEGVLVEFFIKAESKLQ